MEKNTKILLGVGAVIAAYLILKPKKVAAQTSEVNTPNTTPLVFTERQQNINNMYLATDTNGIIQNINSVWNGDRFDDYVIYNNITQQEIDTSKKSYPNSILGNSNYLVANAKHSSTLVKNTTTKTKDCVVSSFNCVTTTYETIQIPIDANCYEYQPENPPCAGPPDRFYPKPDIIDYTETLSDRTNWGTWGN